MHGSLIFRLDSSGLGFLLEREFDVSLDWLFLGGDVLKIVVTDAIFHHLRLMLVLKLLGDLAVHPLFKVDIELILEGVSPLVMLGKVLHAAHEIISQEVFSEVEALELLHGLILLLSLNSSIFKSLVLLFDSSNFLFDFALPLRVFNLSSFVVLKLKFPNCFKFMFLLHFETGLLDSFV